METFIASKTFHQNNKENWKRIDSDIMIFEVPLFSNGEK